MVFPRTMRTAVVQATVLCTITMLYSHYFTQDIFKDVSSDQGWIHMIAALNSSTMPTGTQRGNGRLTLDPGHATNQTISLNQTTSVSLGNGTILNDAEESFYRRKFPRELVVFIIYSALQYWWLIGLERLLPSRPRNREVLSQQKEQIEESEDREEEVVKKWIAQGRVRRASLNWCNTFMKWVIDMTAGRLWLYTVVYIVRTLLKFKSPSKVFINLKRDVFLNFAGAYLSATPLTHLVAFVVVPAHRQIVFIEGVDLAETIFFHTLVRVFATWAVKTNFVQTMMKNVTDSVQSAQTRRLRQERMERYYRAKDEI